MTLSLKARLERLEKEARFDAWLWFERFLESLTEQQLEDLATHWRWPEPMPPPLPIGASKLEPSKEMADSSSVKKAAYLRSGSGAGVRPDGQRKRHLGQDLRYSGHQVNRARVKRNGFIFALVNKRMTEIEGYRSNDHARASLAAHSRFCNSRHSRVVQKRVFPSNSRLMSEIGIFQQLEHFDFGFSRTST